MRSKKKREKREGKSWSFLCLSCLSALCCCCCCCCWRIIRSPHSVCPYQILLAWVLYRLLSLTSLVHPLQAGYMGIRARDYGLQETFQKAARSGNHMVPRCSFFFLFKKDLITLFSLLQQKLRMSNNKRVGVVVFFLNEKKDLITQ